MVLLQNITHSTMIRTLRVVMPVLAVFLLTGMFYMSRGVPELSEIPFASSELAARTQDEHCLLYTSPSPRDLSTSRMPSSA